MCQEGNEKEISKECLRKKVDEIIKTKKICDLDKIDVTKNQLIYMQKYAELLISKDDSIKSYNYGIYGGLMFIAAVGLSWYLFSLPDNQKQLAYLISLFYLIILILLYRWMELKKKEFIDNIEFKHEIILKIQERL